jgi:hypothetical protein
MYILILAVVQSLLILVLGVVLLRLWQKYRIVERQQQTLTEQSDKQRKDQIGLCSAAVQVDKRLMEQEKRLRDMADKMEKMESTATQDSAGSAYYTAVDRIKKGASVQEVVADCGLSLSEANLLHNLYAQKPAAKSSSRSSKGSREGGGRSSSRSNEL